MASYGVTRLQLAHSLFSRSHRRNFLSKFTNIISYAGNSFCSIDIFIVINRKVYGPNDIHSFDRTISNVPTIFTTAYMFNHHMLINIKFRSFLFEIYTILFSYRWYMALLLLHLKLQNMNGFRSDFKENYLFHMAAFLWVWFYWSLEVRKFFYFVFVLFFNLPWVQKQLRGSFRQVSMIIIHFPEQATLRRLRESLFSISCGTTWAIGTGNILK